MSGNGQHRIGCGAADCEGGAQCATNRTGAAHPDTCCCSACWQVKQGGFRGLRGLATQDYLPQDVIAGPPAPAGADPANPSYYTRGGIASADVIDAWQLGPWEAMALKYILRAKFKGNERDDLDKAAWCVARARRGVRP